MQDRLEMFITLVRERHFGRAAEVLGVTQPTLSFGIRALEEQLGAPLVRRGSRYQGLTPEGERIYERALRIVAETRALKEDVHGASGEVSGQIRLGAVPTALTLAAELVSAAQKAHPKLRFRILSQTAGEIADGLGRLDLEAGLSYARPGDSELFDHVPLVEERSSLLVHQSHPMAKRRSVDWGEAASLQPCLLTPGMTNRAIVETRFAAVGVTISPAVDSNSILALTALVKLGDHAIILPERLARSLASGAPLTVVMIEDEAGDVGEPGRVGLLLPRRSAPPPSLVAFKEVALRLAKG
ncbi:LysR family transcriptional regulator [Fulvimarina manganoxydans]|nr:LysR family transcriptional regulator [Fulvimarina manganoxydans]